jgi:hypothetical protein
MCTVTVGYVCWQVQYSWKNPRYSTTAVSGRLPPVDVGVEGGVHGEGTVVHADGAVPHGHRGGALVGALPRLRQEAVGHRHSLRTAARLLGSSRWSSQQPAVGPRQRPAWFVGGRQG